MNCNDCGGFLPRGCECSPFGGRRRVADQPLNTTPVADQKPANLIDKAHTRYSPFDLWFAEWELILPQDARESFRELLAHVSGMALPHGGQPE